MPFRSISVVNQLYGSLSKRQLHISEEFGNGWCEQRLVVLNAVLGNQRLTYEILLTVLTLV